MFSGYDKLYILLVVKLFNRIYRYVYINVCVYVHMFILIYLLFQDLNYIVLVCIKYRSLKYIRKFIRHMNKYLISLLLLFFVYSTILPIHLISSIFIKNNFMGKHITIINTSIIVRKLTVFNIIIATFSYTRRQYTLIENI